jgi:anti-anti-sigma factor
MSLVVGTKPAIFAKSGNLPRLMLMATNRHLQFEIQRNDEKVIVRLKGNLDESSALQLGIALERLRYESEGAIVLLDLRDVRSFHHHGVATLARMIEGLRPQFPEISLTGLESAIESLFRRTGL